MIPQHDIRPAELGEQLAQQWLPPWMRDEIARDADEVRPARYRPVDPAPARDPAPPRWPEVEVGEVCDPKPVELGRQPGELDLEHSGAQPARLEPCVGEERQCDGTQRCEQPDHQCGDSPLRGPLLDSKLFDDRLDRNGDMMPFVERGTVYAHHLIGNDRPCCRQSA